MSKMRSFYSKDWHCDCKPESHTLENYIKGLKNVYGTEDVHYDGDKFIHVNTDDSCILASNIFQSEFHGLILSSIHAQKGKYGFLKIGLLFQYPIQDTTDGNIE